MDTLDQAKAQIQAIVAEIHEQQRRLEYLHSRLGMLRQFVALGEEICRPQPAERASGEVEVKALPAKAILPQDLKTTKDKVIWVCGQVLADGKPRHTRELLASLGDWNIEVGGKDKVLAVSAILSSDHRFQASRKVGWRLAPDKARPESVGAEPGLFVHSASKADPTP